jgi:hypothetical protein
MTNPVAAPPSAARRGQWRLPVVIAGIVLLGGAIIAWLQPAGTPTGYLDPGNTGPKGSHALAAILTQRGEQLTTVTTAAAAGAAANAGTPAAGAQATASQTTILVTNPELLTAAELSSLSHTTANILLADPDKASLAALAPDVTAARPEQAPIGALNPGCTLPAATLAGNADMGGTLLTTTAPNVERCYLIDGQSSLVSYTASGRRITVLGTGAPLTNQDLGNLGNAALTLNLLAGTTTAPATATSQPRVVWLVPPASPVAPPTSGGQATFTSLIPKPVYMVTVQLLVAVLLLALWRVRRLGPLIPERLPAVVRAAETTEGHGRLYHARRSRDRAAEILRDAATRRMLPSLGLPPDADSEATAAALARRTGDNVADITETISGPPPKDDAALVALADRLDELERKAGAR